MPIGSCKGIDRQKARDIVLASSSNGGGAAEIAGVIAIGIYFLPTIVAVARKVTNQGSVAVINFFLGWTLIGWVVALAMACRTSRVGS